MCKGQIRAGQGPIAYSKQDNKLRKQNTYIIQKTIKKSRENITKKIQTWIIFFQGSE